MQIQIKGLLDLKKKNVIFVSKYIILQFHNITKINQLRNLLTFNLTHHRYDPLVN